MAKLTTAQLNAVINTIANNIEIKNDQKKLEYEKILSKDKEYKKLVDKIEELKKYCLDNDLDIDIEVDGGISAKNIAHVKECGANVFVAGSAVFNGDIASSTKEILKAMEAQ